MNAPVEWHRRLHPELAERIAEETTAGFYHSRSAVALAFVAGCLAGWLLAVLH